MPDTIEPGPLPAGTRVQLRDGRAAVLVSVVDGWAAVVRLDDGHCEAQRVDWLTPLAPDPSGTSRSGAPASPPA
jgi:hypothetical protein